MTKNAYKIKTYFQTTATALQLYSYFIKEFEHSKMSHIFNCGDSND